MINFSEVEKSVRELKKQTSNGDITEEVLEETLLTMIDMAQDGCYWMFGHETERWFRHNGTNWILDTPTHQATSTTEQDNLESELYSVDWGWFIASLIIIISIGITVFYSTT